VEQREVATEEGEEAQKSKLFEEVKRKNERIDLDCSGIEVEFAGQGETEVATEVVRKLGDHQITAQAGSKVVELKSEMEAGDSDDSKKDESEFLPNLIDGQRANRG
jgi:hypothetical protein